MGTNDGESIPSFVLATNSKGVDGGEIVDHKVLSGEEEEEEREEGRKKEEWREEGGRREMRKWRGGGGEWR